VGTYVGMLSVYMEENLHGIPSVLMYFVDISLSIAVSYVLGVGI
jgi:hypothetical protein